MTAVLNEIAGKDHSGTKKVPVPTLFGMNFQAINAAKKISANSGYIDHIGTPDSLLGDALGYVDTALGRMVSALKAAGSTIRPSSSSPPSMERPRSTRREPSF